MTIYDELATAGCHIAAHESDLYVKVDDTSRAIIRTALAEKRISNKPTLFRSQHPDDNGALFYELPFAYSPWWRARGFT